MFVGAGSSYVDADSGRTDTGQHLAQDHQAIGRSGPEQPLVELIRFHEGSVPGQQRLSGKFHAPAVVDLEQLDLDNVTLFDHVLGLLGAAMLELADVEQALDPREDLHESTER